METLKSKALLLTVVIILQIQNCIGNTTAEDDCIKVGSTCASICIPANYSKYDHPSLNQPEPTNILVDFLWVNVLKVNDYDSTVSVIILLQLQWFDPRTEFQMDSEEDCYRGYIPLPKTLSDQLWRPDVSIWTSVNELEKHDLMDGRTDENLIIINGTYVAYSRLIEVSIYCPMSFDNYPMDLHNCPFRFMR